MAEGMLCVRGLAGQLEAHQTDHCLLYTSPETPIITMSMGALGAVSRLSGEAIGSAMTFANPGKASAPGQVSLEVVKMCIRDSIYPVHATSKPNIRLQ